MANDPTDLSTRPIDLGRIDVRELEQQVMGRMARGSGTRAPLSTKLARQMTGLSDTFLADENALRHRAIDRLLREGVTASEIIDYVIPEIADDLGRRCQEDHISFVEVTIGSARLQEAVRGLIVRELSDNFGGSRTKLGAGSTVEQASRVLFGYPTFGRSHTWCFHSGGSISKSRLPCGYCR